MPEIDSNHVRPLDAEVGGDADIPGIAQTITVDDVNAILYANLPTDDRRAQLMALKHEFGARMTADGGNDMQAVADEIERALATLDEPGEGVAVDEMISRPRTPDQL
ncbi:MAG: hypothetical protein AAFQ42_08305 [Pseudomonadota bacterium]